MLKLCNKVGLLILLACCSPAQAQWLFTDEQQKPRDYRVLEPVHQVDPKLWEQAPWEQIGPGQRRRVLFNDRMTMVWLELDPAPQQPVLLTHYHAHDQITLLVEGQAEVRLGDQQRVVEAGAAYVAPSNVHHGLRPLSSRVVLVECFTPAREDFRGSQGPRPARPCTHNQVRALVYQWFGLVERKAGDEELLPFWDPLVEKPRRLSDRFIEVKEITIKPSPGGFLVEIALAGAQQRWKVRDWDGFPVISDIQELP